MRQAARGRCQTPTRPVFALLPRAIARRGMTYFTTAQQVAQAVALAIRSSKGDDLARAVAIDLGNTALLAQLTSGALNLEQVCGSALEEPYDEMLYEHFNYLVFASRGEHAKAYAAKERSCVCFQQVYQKDSSWSIEAMHVLNLDLRRAAARADAQLTSKGEKACKLVEAARILQKSFQITVTDRAALGESKKWGALHVINQLFKIYFRLNNLRLCQNLIRAVDGPGFPKALEGEVISGRSFPVAQLVTYHYFVGRLALLNSDFGKAEREVSGWGEIVARAAAAAAPTRQSPCPPLDLRLAAPLRPRSSLLLASGAPRGAPTTSGSSFATSSP